MAFQVSAALPGGVRALHVMDQEADDYDVLAALHHAQLRYVIRADPQRQTETKRCVKDVLATQLATVFRTVRLTPRSEQKAVKTRGRHVARDERNATLPPCQDSLGRDHAGSPTVQASRGPRPSWTLGR